MASFSRLVRFLAKDGRTYYGDAILPTGITDIGKATEARVIPNFRLDDPSCKPSDTIAEIKQLLSPLPVDSVRTVRCLGLNYANHAAESNMPIPTYPVLFYKPPTSITGPFSPIPIPAPAQESEGLDYECELVAIIGRPCLNVPESSALNYVAGYAVGNDVSHRDWQLKRGGGQWALGKGFDGWAPFGPAIVSRKVIEEPQGLRIWTKVNGKVVQESNTRDMVFGVAKTVSLLSRGTTLVPGDMIFTGTPEGVGMGRNPPLWLKDGDVVEVGLEGVGSCVNKVEFVKNAEAKL